MLGLHSYHRDRKPLFGAASIHPTLWNYATSIYLLNDLQTKGTDAKNVNNLTFGAGAAQPSWGYNNGGQALTFDGGDTCDGTVTTVNAFPVWCATSITVGSVAASQGTVSVGSNTGTAFFTIFVTTTNIAWQLRTLDGSTGTFLLNGPASAVGNVYHCAAVSRSDTDHTLFVNGQMYTSATTAGGSWSNLVNGGIGELKRTSVGSQMTGAVHWGAWGLRDPGNAFLRDLTIRPYDYLYGALPNIPNALFGMTAAAANEQHYLMTLGAGS